MRRREDMLEYFPHIRARLAFPTMQEHCATRNLPTGPGWDKLQAKLEEECRLSDGRSSEIAGALADIFRETLPVGRRAVRLYTLPEGDAEAVADYLAGLQREESAFLETYPRPLSPERLNETPSGVFLCEVARSDSDGSVSLVFCGKRVMEEREARTRDQIGAEAINQFGWAQYDEFVLIKRRFIQSYEVLRVDLAGLLQLRIEDQPGVDTWSAFEQLLVKANGLLATRFGAQHQLIASVNLFPAIKSMYDDAQEGIVVELGFTTDTGSSKHEKMRSNRADLRAELFHVGGKEAINGALTPFRVAVRWSEAGERAQEEALLPGSIRQLAGASPFLDHMVLSGSMTEAKMRAMIQRVVRHLPPAA